jgi:hypothetical protein
MPDELSQAHNPSGPIEAPRADGYLHRHRTMATLLALLVIAWAVGFLTWYYWPGPKLSPPTRAWYTVDDGVTRFEDELERLPPFDHQGKQAVRTHVFSCDDGKTTFVAYLQKLPQEVFKKYRDKGVDPATVDDDELAFDSGWLYKRPVPAPPPG